MSSRPYEDSPSFFALIIGTEILERRRTDSHFDFLSSELLDRGWRLSGSFVVEDDPALIVQSIKFLASQPGSVIFSYGGIGSTPDDHTRKCASIALRDGRLHRHPEAEKIITGRLGERAYPHPINMADLPSGAKLLENPVNGMPAFYLDDRYFFMPGFPSMSHPMTIWALDNIFGRSTKSIHRKSLMALCRESELIDVMRTLPDDVELSSLPRMYDDGPRVEITLSSTDPDILEEAYRKFEKVLEEKSIHFGEVEKRP
jgi:molybdopterin-biosynthesis enzyme MoeA-like protein